MIKEQDKIVRLLSALFPDIKIYLFGSRARGTQKVTSDIDLALDVGRLMTTLEIAQAKNVLEALNIPQKIDVVDVYAIPTAMKAAILKEAVIWKA